MSENTKATENTEITEIAEHTTTKYTLNYVLEQIENLQKQLTENSFHSLHRLEATIDSIYGTDSEAENEERNCLVACVCDVFQKREETLQRILSFYEKMYDDLKPKAAEPIDPVLKTFTDMLELDTALIKPEYRERIMQQMVEYAKQLKQKRNSKAKTKELQRFLKVLPNVQMILPLRILAPSFPSL